MHTKKKRNIKSFLLKKFEICVHRCVVFFWAINK